MFNEVLRFVHLRR